MFREDIQLKKKLKKLLNGLANLLTGISLKSYLGGLEWHATGKSLTPTLGDREFEYW